MAAHLQGVVAGGGEGTDVVLLVVEEVPRSAAGHGFWFWFGLWFGRPGGLKEVVFEKKMTQIRKGDGKNMDK